MNALGSAGRLFSILFRSEHFRSAARAVFRGASRELINHLKTRYAGQHSRGSRQ